MFKYREIDVSNLSKTIEWEGVARQLLFKP
ncbi:hypothetical protein TPHSE_36030 [Terrisporobacter petrolearius]